MRARLLLTAALLVCVAGCAEQRRPLYYWNGYDEHLYDHYKHPQDPATWVARMREVVTAAEQEGRRVPPGVYAEYGYALLEGGDATNAVVYFEKERQLWPESTAFMSKMIQTARRAAPAPSATAGEPQAASQVGGTR